MCTVIIVVTLVTVVTVVTVVKVVIVVKVVTEVTVVSVVTVVTVVTLALVVATVVTEVTVVSLVTVVTVVTVALVVAKVVTVVPVTKKNTEKIHVFFMERKQQGSFTKPPLLQMSRLIGSGNPFFESCVEGKAQQWEIHVYSRSTYQIPHDCTFLKRHS